MTAITRFGFIEPPPRRTRRRARSAYEGQRRPRASRFVGGYPTTTPIKRKLRPVSAPHRRLRIVRVAAGEVDCQRWRETGRGRAKSRDPRRVWLDPGPRSSPPGRKAGRSGLSEADHRPTRHPAPSQATQIPRPRRAEHHFAAILDGRQNDSQHSAIEGRSARVSGSLPCYW